MQLLLMRHGEASYTLGATDKERPLTDQGRAESARRRLDQGARTRAGAHPMLLARRTRDPGGAGARRAQRDRGCALSRQRRRAAGAGSTTPVITNGSS